MMLVVLGLPIAEEAPVESTTRLRLWWAQWRFVTMVAAAEVAVVLITEVLLPAKGGIS